MKINKDGVKKVKKPINTHFISMAALSFVLGAILVELCVFISFANELDSNIYIVTLYVIPSFAAIVTSVLIYVNHRTFAISNKLIGGLNKIAEGNYDVRMDYKKLDSFNAVYANFNKMAAELKSVRALREDFVHDFSHEFKTPIASINGFANLLLEGGLTEEDEKKILKIIADESARLSHLAENTLMLSKIENQQFVGESKPFRLDVQIKECIIQLAGEWEKKGIIIDSRLEQITYTGDCNLLRQVWINLLSNAIKFTPELGGKIAVRLYKSSEGIIAKVSDNGVGVAAEDRQKIFEKYYQFGHGGGNGLGLTICKRICQICGGDIRVTSAPGKGTTFIVTL